MTNKAPQYKSITREVQGGGSAAEAGPVELKLWTQADRFTRRAHWQASGGGFKGLRPCRRPPTILPFGVVV